MKTKSEKLEYLFEKYKSYVDGDFHNTLWKLLIDEVRKDVKSAFVYLFVSSNGANVGIADYNENGYVPATFSIKSDIAAKQREEMIDELNLIVFDLSPKEAFNIVLSSMKL